MYQMKTHISLKGFDCTFDLRQISIFVIFFGHRVKPFLAFPVIFAMVTLIWSFLNYYFCICITDIDCIKYVENYSYFVLLEGDSLHRICPFC